MRSTYNYKFEEDGKIMHNALHTHTACIVKKGQDLGTVLRYYSLGSPLKIQPCEFFLME